MHMTGTAHLHAELLAALPAIGCFLGFFSMHACSSSGKGISPHQAHPTCQMRRTSTALHTCVHHHVNECKHIA